MKPIRFLGDSLERLKSFPVPARRDAGFQLRRVQQGEQPHDFRPMPTIGRGVEEIRIRLPNGAYRVIFLARRTEAIYVLHAFAKKSQATARRDLALARQRCEQLGKEMQ